MKILVLMASPKVNGTIDKLADVAISEMQKFATVEKVFVNKLNVKPCIGCMKCRSLEKCVLPLDDAHGIAEKIKSSDGILIATPVYWGNMNGYLKVLFDRLVYVMMGENSVNFPVPKNKGKKAMIITSCTTNKIGDFFAGESRNTHRSLKEILGYSGFKTIGAFNKNNTKENKTITLKEINAVTKISRKFM